MLVSQKVDSFLSNVTKTNNNHLSIKHNLMVIKSIEILSRYSRKAALFHTMSLLERFLWIPQEPLNWWPAGTTVKQQNIEKRKFICL